LSLPQHPAERVTVNPLFLPDLSSVESHPQNTSWRGDDWLLDLDGNVANWQGFGAEEWDMSMISMVNVEDLEMDLPKDDMALSHQTFDSPASGTMTGQGNHSLDGVEIGGPTRPFGL
jgi:hypothetical protein